MKLQNIKVSENKRFLQQEDGTPFFWLADTGWELFHGLSKEEVKVYLENRKSKKFNVIQAVLLAEFNGLDEPNFYGKYPLLKDLEGNYDPTKLDLSDKYNYWDNVDYILSLAEENGLYIAILPTWGDKYNISWGKGPEIFNENNAYEYGKILGNRYKNKTNIIWVLGGDRPLVNIEHFIINKKMAEGIKDGGGKQLITFHPCGGDSSTKQVGNESWVDFNLIQSGHSHHITPTYKMIQQDYEHKCIKPTIDSEPNYEDHPIGFKPENGYFDDVDIRRASYWSVFAGGAGITYGHHSIWSFWENKKEYLKKSFPNDNNYFIMEWHEALNRPASFQMKYLKELIESVPYFERVPAQEIICKNYEGGSHIVATKGKRYAFLYCPNGVNPIVKLGVLEGLKISAKWYNPKNGEYIDIEIIDNVETKQFETPSKGRENDWVLVLKSI